MAAVFGLRQRKGGIRVMAKEFKLSQSHLKALEDELNYLHTTREKEVAEMIKEARSFGDLSENSEYDEAKNEQGKLYARIAEIENILAHATIIEEHEEEGSVGMGSQVTVRDIETGDEEVFEIVGGQEAAPLQGRVSDDSPFGRAVIGRRAGDQVTVEAPMGQFHYEILTVTKKA